MSEYLVMVGLLLFVIWALVIVFPLFFGALAFVGMLLEWTGWFLQYIGGGLRWPLRKYGEWNQSELHGQRPYPKIDHHN